MDWFVPALFWPTFLWTVYLGPILHVCLSPAAGPWRAPAGSSCPFSPRVGWLVMVVFLGPIGWLLFVLRPRRGA